MKLFLRSAFAVCLFVVGSSTLVNAQSTETYGIAADGAVLQWSVYAPAGSGPWPVVLVIHGGGFRGGGRKGPEISACAADLTNAGFLALSIDYRLAPPGALTGQTSTGQGSAQYEDVEMAVRAARADPRCNGQVGALGGSAGGTHATWVAITPDLASRVNVAVSLSGAYDFTDFSPDPNIEEFTRNVTNLAAVSNPPLPEEIAILESYSPIAHVDATAAPLFLVNSAYDPMPFAQFPDMIAKLRSLGLENFQTLTLPGAAHSFGNWPAARAEALAFLARGFGVGNEPPQPPTAPSITRQPQNRTAAAGKSAKFVVTATGDKPLVYQWLRDGVAIEGATAPSYQTPPATPDDNGALFSVTVSNAAGEVTSNQAGLRVK